MDEGRKGIKNVSIFTPFLEKKQLRLYSREIFEIWLLILLK